MLWYLSWEFIWFPILKCFTDKTSWFSNKIQKQNSPFWLLFGLIFKPISLTLYTEKCRRKHITTGHLGIFTLGFLVGLFSTDITGLNTLKLKGHLDKTYSQIKSRFLGCFLGVGLLPWRTASSSMKTHWDAL